MEKLDRNAFDPREIYDLIAILGVRWVRIQSGWAKTEKAQGVYDFGWLDDIVDELLKRDLSPWICLCYGNGIYDEVAAARAGGVGCPPTDTVAMTAWLRYCAETARRYAGKVEYYEIWNEPDFLWTVANDPKSYTDFCIATARVVREADPQAKIIVGAVASIDPTYLNACLEYGVGQNADALSYHAYTYDERTFAELNRYYASLCRARGCPLHIIHGESGSQSRNGGNGAFKGFATNPTKQAKHLLRQMLTDRMSGAFFSSYFTATDMHENLQAKAGKAITQHGYFGVLQSAFDPNGIACAPFVPKPSFYALQRLCAFLPDNAVPIDLPYRISSAKDQNNRPLLAVQRLFCRRIGSYWRDPRRDRLTTAAYSIGDATTLIWWQSTDLLNDRTFSSTVDIGIYEQRPPLLVDLLSGEVSDISYESKDGHILIRDLPVRDYPLALVFGAHPYIK